MVLKIKGNFKISLPVIIAGSLSIAVLFFFLGLFYEKRENGIAVYSNEQLIQGLFSTLDLSSTDSVFAFVFNSLADNVNVYPTENYYYLFFYSLGKKIRAVIHLPVDDIENGIIHFSYVEDIDLIKTKNLDAFNIKGEKTYGKDQGIQVNKLTDFKYKVTYQHKTVVFNLNDIGIKRPVNTLLRQSEVFVGPSFDESGIAFHLIFNKKNDHLYWLLNDDILVTDTLIHFYKNIYIGNRTDFAFYYEKETNRKILIGAKGSNVVNNTWYDGPFDQMPDNYVKINSVHVKTYLEMRYPEYKDQIDMYGKFTSKKGRIPVANYSVYFSLDYLKNMVDQCIENHSTDTSSFYKCITQQIYNLPQEFFNK
jgi:hypothetical protein